MRITEKFTIAGIRVWFIAFLALAAVQIIMTLALSVNAGQKAAGEAEGKFHELNRNTADYYLKSTAEGGKGVILCSDSNNYVAVIDDAGDILAFNDNSDINMTSSNLFKYLSKGKIISHSYDDSKALIVGGSSGKIEIFNDNSTKVLFYTPAGAQGYTVIRIMEKSYYQEINAPCRKAIINMAVFIILFTLLMFFVVTLLYRYTLMVEYNNRRQSVIAEDNDLVSFTYHASIACFEVSGAVDKMFGQDISRTNRIDWKTFSSVLHPDDATLISNISQAIRDKENKYSTEFRMISPNGDNDYHWYRLNGKSIVSSDGQTSKFVGTIQNSDDQITHENMLKNKAEHDLLTGLLNKMTTEDTVNRAISEKECSMYAFYIIDLDNFKSVNDKLGHAVGDEVLVDVASKLDRIFNESDFIGRLGGDEFCSVLSIPANMVSQADRLIKEKARLVNEHLVASYGSTETVEVTASVGISVFPANGSDFQALYKSADKALYYSKEHGKNRHTFYDDIKDK